MTSSTEKEVKNNGQDNEHFGFVLAIIFLIIGASLFFFWETFGNEIVLKLISIPFIFFGFAGLGQEISNQKNDDGGLEMGIGLGFSSTGLVLKSALPIIPNLIIFFIIIAGAFAISLSIARLVKTRKNVNTSAHIFYRVVLISGQIAGAILSISELIELLS